MPEVLYRKWRPGNLSDLVGQPHVTQTLTQAMRLDRVSHAYLFCGPRGTGKTSTARILAKAVNCLYPIDGAPDEICTMCTSISEGRAIDLIEIDAASNRRIADIRDLTEKIHYGPGEAKFKVYIIDEVHMLTQEAFNALLKTLEEPPSHAILVLATTDVQKVPLTIVSRCQRFDFRRIPADAICRKLTSVCKDEGVEVEPEALDLIARKSTGSLRDAENILDQVIVSFDSPITEQNLRDFLNLSDDIFTAELLRDLIKKDAVSSLRLVSNMVSAGSEPKQIHANLVDLAREFLLLKSGVITGSGLSDSAQGVLEPFRSDVSIVQLLHIGKTLNNVDFRNSISEILPLELGLIEATVEIGQATLASEKALHVNKGVEPKMRSKVSVEHNKILDESRISRLSNIPSEHPNNYDDKVDSPEITSENDKLTSLQVQDRSELEEQLDANWNEILRSLRRVGNRFNIAALLRGSMQKSIQGSVLIITFQYSSHVERIKGELDDPSVMNELKQVVEGVLGSRFEVDIQLRGEDPKGNGRPASQRSQLVRSAQSLGARIVEERGKQT